VLPTTQVQEYIIYKSGEYTTQYSCWAGPGKCEHFGFYGGLEVPLETSNQYKLCMYYYFTQMENEKKR